MRRLLSVSVALFFLFGSGGSWAQDRAPDLILVNGKVVTVDDLFSITEAVAIRGERIVAVGATKEIRSLAGPNTYVTNLDGRTVIPGLIDNHTHMVRASRRWAQEVRLDGITSRSQALDMIKTRARSLKSGEWILVLGGWALAQFRDETSVFTKAELDLVAPNNPVFLQMGFSQGFANSLALKAAGIDERTQDPSGEKFLRDRNGKLAGVLLGGVPIREFLSKLPEVSQEGLMAGARSIIADFNRAGITALLDVGSFGGLNDKDYAPFRELAEEGKLTVRTFYTFWTEAGTPQQAEKAIERLKTTVPFQGDNYFDLIGVGETLYLPIHDSPRQPPIKPTSEQTAVIRKMASTAAESGWHVHLHAVHDQTIHNFVDIFEDVHKQHPIKPLRWVFAHVDGIAAPTLERIRQLGMSVLVHSRPTIAGKEEHEAYGEQAFVRPPLRLIENSGLLWGLGSDTSIVAPYLPFISLWWATTGKMLDGSVVNTQTVSRERALIAHTRSNAYFLFQENNLGSIEPGKLADMVVLDRDYMTVPLMRSKISSLS